MPCSRSAACDVEIGDPAGGECSVQLGHDGLLDIGVVELRDTVCVLVGAVDDALALGVDLVGIDISIGDERPGSFLERPLIDPMTNTSTWSDPQLADIGF
jgi:hypothetical protein